MRTIYHILLPHEFQHHKEDFYRAKSLSIEGFIHCSNAGQVERVANLFYAEARELTVLRILVDRLTSPVRDEDPGTGELFPHVYGPIDRAAITGTEALQRDTAGRWSFANTAL
jgi:uncharacterized protein (DUF952 family)